MSKALIKSIIGPNIASVLFAGFVYYKLSYKPRKLKHDTEVAKEFCSQELRSFAVCSEEKHLDECQTSMLILNDCIYRKKGVNQEDKDLF